MIKSVPTFSVVVPIYNESAGIKAFHISLKHELNKLSKISYEIIYCNDGSSDETIEILKKICADDKACRVLSLSKNFGKEAAIVAGMRQATGQAVILMDGDGQHPVDAIGEFYAAWKRGTQVVIGRRTNDDTETFGKKIVSKLFYTNYNFITGNQLDPCATDYRLLDREVVDAYYQLGETNRLNRFLIDWLGFEREYVSIDRRRRIAGSTKFTIRSLLRLAVDTLISSSTRPLYALLIAGSGITVLSFISGIAIGFEQVVLRDPLRWNFTGTALLSILVIFLVGIILVSQGVVSLYIAALYRQVKQRPLYIINKRHTYNIDI